MAYTPKQNNFKKSQKKPYLSKEEYAEKRKAEKDALYQLVEDGITDILSGQDGLFKYLDVQSKFDAYSVSNAILIAQQMPQAKQLKSYEGWADLKIQVKQKSRSISILEPSPYTDKEGNERISFVVKKMFDISQTTARQQTTQTIPDLKEITKALMKSSIVECKVAEKLPIQNSAAYYNEKDNVVYLAESNPVKLFQDIVRELALAEISYNDNEYNRVESLPSANCTAYMICKRYGVDTKDIPVADVFDAWKNKEPKEIRINLAMARDSNKAINTELYKALHKEAPEQSQER